MMLHSKSVKVSRLQVQLLRPRSMQLLTDI
jgi:hypothetical protein